MFELDIELYFWMIDRGDFEDDQRNQVDVSKQRVKLYREHSQRLENGFYIGKLMHAIRKTIIKKSRKPFTLDPVLANLKDQSTLTAREYNWNFVVAELRKFNIKISQTSKHGIIQESKHNLVVDILRKLQEYDQNLLAYNPNEDIYFNDGIGQGLNGQNNFSGLGIMASRNASQDKKKDNNSEINYGGLVKDAVERKIPRGADAESHANALSDKGSELNRPLGNSKSSAIIMGAPLKKSMLDPINQMSSSTIDKDGLPDLKRQNPNSLIQLHSMERVGNSDLEKSINIDPHDLSKIDHTNDSMEFEVARNEKLRGEGTSTDLQEADSSVLFIIGSLKISFNMRHNQVGGLLANSNKYLILTCIKGLKGSDFQKIIYWYQLLMKNLGHLIFLLQNEPDQIRATLNVLRCGLYSKSADVANLACRLLTKIITIINENSQNQGMINFKHHFWEWLIQMQQTTNNKPPPSPIKPGGKMPKSRKQADLESTLSESGLSTFLRAQIRHTYEFIEALSAFLMQIGQDNFVDLLTHHMRTQAPTHFSYLEIMHGLFSVLIHTNSGKVMFIESGVLNLLVDMCLQFADMGSVQSPAPTGFQNASNQIKQRVDERMLSLTVLTDIWKEKPDFVQARPTDSRMSEAILSVLKRGCRDKAKTVAILSTNLLSSLLDVFSKSRNRFAPVIYKALTFIMVDTFSNHDLRQEMLHNFIILFRSQPQIPIQILCDPLLKQIQINIEKQDFMEGSQNILQPMGEKFFLNSTDFEFFMNIATHPKLNSTNAVQLLQIVNEISRKNIIFTRISLKLLLTILNRFENNTAVFEFCQNDILKVMKVIQDQDTVKRDMHTKLIQNPKVKIAIKKQSVSFAQQVNQSMEQPQFSSIASKNTLNAKYKNNDKPYNYEKAITSPGLGSGTKSKGIISDGKYSTAEYIDDTDLQQILNPKYHQEESSHYMRMKTQEKMIINQLQCFINTGIKVLVEFIRHQLLETYIKIEKRLKFKNKGILYLLQLFDKDVTKMLQYYYKEQSKIRAEKIRERKQRERELAIADGDLLVSRTFDGADFSTNDDFNPVGSINERINITTLASRDLSPPEISNSRALTVKKANPYNDGAVIDSATMKNRMSKLRSQKQLSSLDFKQGSSLTVKKSTNKLYGLGDPYQRMSESIDSASNLQRRQLGEPVSVRALSIGRSKREPPLKLYDPLAFPGEMEHYKAWVIQYTKLYKAIFHKYASSAPPRSTLKKVTFDHIQEQRNLMSFIEVFQFMNDFKINTNFPTIKRETIKRIIKLINLQKFESSKSNNDLDLAGFVEFVMQLAYVLYNRLDKVSVFLPLFFRYLKDVSFESPQPLFQRLFEDPQASSIGDPEVIRELQRKVNTDPSYVLPPGFVKFPTFDVKETYEAPEERTEPEKICVEIVDDLFSEIFGNHYLYPKVRYERRWGVKPDIFQMQKRQKIKPSYMKISDKYQYKSKYRQPDMFDDTLSLEVSEGSPNISRSRDARLLGNSRRRSSLGYEKANTSLSRGTPARSSLTVRKKIPMRMETSLEPELDLSLKIHLAQNLLNPNRKELKESAFLMQDMLRALEQGKTTLTPRAMGRIYNTGSKPKNKVMQDRLEKQAQENLNKEIKQYQFENRDQVLKKKLAQHQYNKQIMKQYELIKVKEEKAKMKEQEAKARQKKEAYYEQLQKEFEDNRLPQIKETHQKELELHRLQREKRAKDREAAEQKIQKNTEDMINTFKKKKQDKDEALKKKMDDQDKQKSKKNELNRKLTQNYQKREAVKKEKMEQELQEMASRSPVRTSIQSNKDLHSPARRKGEHSGARSPSKSRATSAVKQSQNPNLAKHASGGGGAPGKQPVEQQQAQQQQPPPPVKAPPPKAEPPKKKKFGFF